MNDNAISQKNNGPKSPSSNPMDVVKNIIENQIIKALQLGLQEKIFVYKGIHFVEYFIVHYIFLSFRS